MSTPSKPLSEAYGGTCCDDNAPIPAWFRYINPITGVVTEEAARAKAIAAWENPDRQWCPRCSTALEDFRDSIEDVAPTFLRAVATIASFIPGFGTIAADILGTMAALAAGESIEDSFLEGLLDALPGGPVWAAAGEAAKSLVEGERIDRAFLDGVRAGIYEVGGPLAAAAYDGVIAVARGKALQDAGFAALHVLAAGNSLEEKALTYGEQITRAVESGRNVLDVLVGDLAQEVAAQAGPLAFRAAASVVQRIKLDPSLLDVSPATLASLAGTSEAVARGAQAVMRTGTEDHELSSAIFPQLIVSAAPSSATQVAQKVASSVVLSPALRFSLVSTKPVIRPSVAAAITRATIQPVTPTVQKATPKAAAPAAAASVRSPAGPATPATSGATAAAVGAGIGAAGLLVAWLVWRR